MSQKLKELFQQKVPDFLQAWEELQVRGFFDTLHVKADGEETDDAFHIRIVFSGGLLNAGERRPQGIAPYFHPQVVIENLQHRFQEGTFEIAHFFCETKYDDWKSEGGNSKGRKVLAKLNLRLVKAEMS